MQALFWGDELRRALRASLDSSSSLPVFTDKLEALEIQPVDETESRFILPALLYLS